MGMRKLFLIISILTCLVSSAQNPMMRLIRHTASVGYDADAQSYIDRVETALGSGLTTPVKDAINDFVVGLKNNSLWTKIYDAGMFIGETATTHAETLKGVNDITWFNSPTHASTGTVGNGTNQYGNTNINASTALTLNNSHAAFYLRTNNNVGVGDIGAQSATNSRITIFPRSAANYISDHNSNVVGRLTAANAVSTGFYVSTRVSSTDYRAFKNGTQLGTTNATTNDGTFPNLTITIMGVNNSGTVSTFSTREMCYWSVGLGFSSAECSTYNTLVEALQDVLSRGLQ